MVLAPIFQKVFSKLLGNPCWNVKPGYGSFLTLEFGQPKLEISDPRTVEDEPSAKLKKHFARRHVYLRGEWHLWIYCCEWFVSHGEKPVGDYTSKRRIQKAAEELNGQKLSGLTVIKRGCQTIFEFDLGGVLETRPYDRKGEQWMLYEPTGKVLTLKADKSYCYHSGNTPPAQEKWFPIDVGRP